MTGSMADTVGRLNPMRYRGYYYDSETGYYYLQSRYYDPEIGRFINADASHILQLAKDQSGGMNLFAYCFNDPINSVDPTGYRAINITSRLLSFMRANARTFANYISQQIKRFGIALGNVLILNYFVNRVKTGGIWDLKRRPEWKLKNRYDYYVFMGRIITAEDIGNIISDMSAEYFYQTQYCVQVRTFTRSIVKHLTSDSGGHFLTIQEILQ